MIISIGVAVLVGLLVILVIRNLTTNSRNGPGSDPSHYHGDVIHHASYLVHPSNAEAKEQDGGHSGGRDMSQDHHVDAGNYSERGSWGGDTGGGGGGGE